MLNQFLLPSQLAAEEEKKKRLEQEKNKQETKPADTTSTNKFLLPSQTLTPEEKKKQTQITEQKPAETQPKNKSGIEKILDTVKNKVKEIINDPKKQEAAKAGASYAEKEFFKTIFKVPVTDEQVAKIKEFGTNIIRATPRAAATVAVTATGYKEPGSTTPGFTPGKNFKEDLGSQIAGKAEKFVFGEEPIRDIKGTGEETVKQFGGNPEQASKYGLATGVVLTGLDLMPGISKKGVATTLAKETNPTVIKNILQTKVFKNLPDLVADGIAQKLSFIDDAKLVQKELDNLASSKTIKLLEENGVPVATQKSAKSALETIPQQVNKLIPDEVPLPAKSDIRSAVSSPEVYTKAPKFVKAIDKTAETLKEQPSTVRRVVSKIAKIKTGFTEKFQDEQIRVRQLVENKDFKVNDVSNPYLKATLYSGRVASRIEKGKQASETVIKDIKNLSTDLKTDFKTVRKEVNDYLYFKHAPERNKALGEKAAGISTKEANNGLKALEASPQAAKIKAIASQVSDLNSKTLDLLKDSGVISDELHTTLRTRYKNHVPLNRIFEESDDVGSILSGKGFDVKTTGIKSAKGSEREVADILENVVSNYEQAVLRSEKNIVDQATLAFARNNKAALRGILEVKKPRPIGKTFDEKIILEKTNDPRILQMFEKGKPVWIKVKDPQLAVALKGIGKEKIGTLLNAVGTFTRLYSGLATRFNPEFFLPNKIRDLQETAVYLSSQKDIGFRGVGKAVSRDPQSIKDVMDSLRGANTKGAKLYQEMKDMGGTTGGFSLSTKKEVALNFKKLESLANSKPKRLADNLVNYVDNWNTIFEDSTRLSVYKTALDKGLSKDRAAFLAKEASINFNRMGTGGPLINALYMFSNASIQGSAKMLKSLKNPKVLAAVTVAVGSSVGAVNQWNDKVDPEWRNKVSKWDRLNGLPIMLPSTDGGAHYITIPVSWGIKPIKVMTDHAYDALSGQNFDSKKMINDTLTAAIEAYNPAGGTDLLSALAPTILDTPSELGRNVSWSGNKIKPDTNKNAPADIQYFDSLKDTKTGQAAISISEIIQNKTGVAISPADIKYAYEQYTGGAGRAITKTINAVTGAFDEKPTPLDEYPLISRFYKARSEEEVGAGAGGDTEDVKNLLEEQSRERFKLSSKAEKEFERLDKLSGDERLKKSKEIYESDPELYKKMKEIKEDKALGLNYTERLIKQLGVENGERAKYILKKANEFKNKDEKNAYLKDLYDKKVLTDKVLEQVKYYNTKQ